MNEALATRNYDGVFVHRVASTRETLRIIHRVKDGRMSERLVSTDGSGREFMRNGAEWVAYFPDRKVAIAEQRNRPSGFIAALNGLSQRNRGFLRDPLCRAPAPAGREHARDHRPPARWPALRLPLLDRRKDRHAVPHAAGDCRQRGHRGDLLHCPDAAGDHRRRDAEAGCRCDGIPLVATRCTFAGAAP